MLKHKMLSCSNACGRLLISYIGTAFAGWQVQRHRDTVQGCLEEALGTILGEPVGVVGAGRTDAGVHARGQVAHFRTGQRMDPDSLRRALNSLLPREIQVRRLTWARPGFHARHDAVGKLYRYWLHVGGKPPPFTAPFVARIPGRAPEPDSMRQAARYLLGRHDFSAFCGSGAAVRDFHRTVRALEVTRNGDTIGFHVEGDGFLRHQVRNMIGTLVQVGQGKRSPCSVAEVLKSGDRREAGPTAPASGLCLLRVRYPRYVKKGREARE
ncbi:MAG: tRNA pseudouridine(38-40) synthase TruA [Acidobacteriota bacterium]